MICTVAICTRNRASSLRKTIESILHQRQINLKETEVLIVDNGSTDETSEVVLEFRGKIPVLSYVYEDRLGTAPSRNRAIREAKGEYIAFIDDDARATPEWLTHHVNAWKEGYQATVGPVDLDWEEKKPDWMNQRFETLYTKYDFGDKDCLLPADGYLITTNAAFKKSLLEEMYGFHEKLGHRGKRLIGVEDIHLFHRLTAKGILIRYVSRAKVIHSVSLERKTKKWLFMRMFWEGVGISHLDFLELKPGFRQLRYDVFQTLNFAIRLIFAAKNKRAETIYHVFLFAGRCYGDWILMRGKDVTQANG